VLKLEISYRVIISFRGVLQYSRQTLSKLISPHIKIWYIPDADIMNVLEKTRTMSSV
jgi:hypothetical protein